MLKTAGFSETSLCFYRSTCPHVTEDTNFTTNPLSKYHRRTRLGPDLGNFIHAFSFQRTGLKKYVPEVSEFSHLRHYILIKCNFH